jgi:hypothetical protein
MSDWDDIKDRIDDLERNNTAARPFPLDEKTIWDEDVEVVRLTSDDGPDVLVESDATLYYVEDLATAWTSAVVDEAYAEVMEGDDETENGTNGHPAL